MMELMHFVREHRCDQHSSKLCTLWPVYLLLIQDIAHESVARSRVMHSRIHASPPFTHLSYNIMFAGGQYELTGGTCRLHTCSEQTRRMSYRKVWVPVTGGRKHNETWDATKQRTGGEYVWAFVHGNGMELSELAKTVLGKFTDNNSPTGRFTDR